MGGNHSSSAPSSGKSYIEKTISEHSVVVFSKSTCPYCARVKKLFGDVRADIFLVEINKRNDMSTLQDELSRITGARTVINYRACIMMCVHPRSTHSSYKGYRKIGAELFLKKCSCRKFKREISTIICSYK